MNTPSSIMSCTVHSSRPDGPAVPARSAVYNPGFTLLELLVVISIIALLASMLLPVLGRSKRSAHVVACMSNLRQIGMGLQLYIQDNQNRLPVCAQLPSLSTNLIPITVALEPYLRAKDLFACPSDRSLFATEQTSYEWNHFLNGASYDHPEDWTPVTQGIVNMVFGGRYFTPLIGDANPFHPAQGQWMGKNALYFDGRVEKTRRPPSQGP